MNNKFISNEDVSEYKNRINNLKTNNDYFNLLRFSYSISRKCFLTDENNVSVPKYLKQLGIHSINFYIHYFNRMMNVHHNDQIYNVYYGITKLISKKYSGNFVMLGIDVKGVRSANTKLRVYYKNEIRRLFFAILDILEGHSINLFSIFGYNIQQIKIDAKRAFPKLHNDIRFVKKSKNTLICIHKNSDEDYLIYHRKGLGNIKLTLISNKWRKIRKVIQPYKVKHPLTPAEPYKSNFLRYKFVHKLVSLPRKTVIVKY